MENNNHLSIKLISILTLLVIITGVFVIAFTFAGDPENPDAIATYTRNKLTWDSGTTVNNDIADLNFFGDPQPGEQYPLIHPNSKGTYYLRLKNDVRGKIGYSVYLYHENTVDIPLEFTAPNENVTTPTVLPTELEGKEIVSYFTGEVDGQNLKNFKIDWQWKSTSDSDDTTLGNQAVTEDLIYTIKVLIVIEDNNSYSSGSGSSGVRLLHRKYIAGYPDGSFKPENNMARSEVSAIFARILADYDENNLTSTKTGFNDVAASDWCAKYIARLSTSGIIKGYGDGTFKPNNPITRAEFATMCVRFFEGRTESITDAKSDFTDVADDHWAKDYIDKAAKQGFVTGYPDGTFGPDNYITRAEVVTVVNRMLSRYPDKKYIDNNLDKLTKFTDVTDNTHWAYYEIFEAANVHHTRLSKDKESWISTK